MTSSSSSSSSYCQSLCKWFHDSESQESDTASQSSNLSRHNWSSSPSMVRRMEQRLLPSSAIEVHRKLVVLGYRGVGKSALTAMFVDNQFLDVYEPTIEYTFRTTLIRNHIRFVCDILDTSAQDEYSTLSRQACLGVHGYIFVYSTTSLASLENIKVVRERVISVIGVSTVPMILVATKADLESSREVRTLEGQQLASNWGCPFIECSAKNNWNVEDIFLTLLDLIEKDSGLLLEEPEENCTIS